METASSLSIKIQDVDAAIEAALTGASYSIAGRSVTSQDIPDLRDQRTFYVRQYNQIVSGGTDVTVATFPPV